MVRLLLALITAAPLAASKTLTRAERVERARAAGKASTSLDAYVRRVVRKADQLTPEHIEQLRALLPPDDARPTR